MIATGSVLTTRAGARRRRQAREDLAQARAERARGRRLSRVSGAPMFRRARSAEQFAGWLDGDTHVRAADVVDVSSAVEQDQHLVTVRLASGAERIYRSPDPKLPELLGAFGRSVHLG